MPMRIEFNPCKKVNVRRYISRIFQPCKRISIHRRISKIRAERIRLIQERHNRAERLIKNVHVNRYAKMVYKTLDILNPFLYKHPKLNKIVMNISEKLVKSLQKDVNQVL